MWKLLLVAAALGAQQTSGMVAESSTTTTISNHQQPRSSASWIDEGLWLGGATDVDISTMTSVVDCRFTFGAKFHDRKAKTLKSLERNVDTLQYLAYLIHCSRDGRDNDNNTEHNNEVLLVHCARGRNRGPASLAAYFMIYQGLSLTEALVKIRLARPKSKTWDNTFILELKQIAKQLVGAPTKQRKKKILVRRRRSH
jgi:hypothetical protein